MRRITLAKVSGIVGVFAVGCATMRAPTIEGAQVVFSLVFAVHSVGLLGTILRRGRDPAWLGFSLLGWLAFVVITTDWFDGNSGFSAFPTAQLAQSAFAIAHPVPEAPVVAGVRLVDEPDKINASDAALQAYKSYQENVAKHDEQTRRIATMADLLATVMAALVGAWLGPRLVPVPDHSSGGEFMTKTDSVAESPERSATKHRHPDESG